MKSDLITKGVYNAKIKNIEGKTLDITNLATTTTTNAKINEVKGKIPSITNLATTNALNAKLNEVWDKIPNIINLAPNTVLAAVGSKIPNVSNLVKKTDYNTQIGETKKKITDHNHDKYITIPEFNKLTAENLSLRLAQANLAGKNNIAALVNKINFDDKLKNVTSNKNELNELSKKVKNIPPKGLRKDLINKFSILNGAKYFSSRIFQNYLIFIPDKKYINNFNDTNHIYSWKSNGMPEESIQIEINQTDEITKCNF